MNRKKILEVTDLSVTIPSPNGAVHAVQKSSWYVKEAETIAIVGESGCGKSVSIQTVMGLYDRRSRRVIEGSVRFHDRELLELSEKEMRRLQGDRMSFIFQDPFTFLDPTMTVGHQITEAYRKHHRVSGAEAKRIAIEMMRTIAIPDPEKNFSRYPHQFSGGMRQRIMIAIALICNPEILFADEPTTALDVTIQAQIIELMKELKDRFSTSIVLITHDMGVVANMAERIYVMYAGRIVESGSAEEIFYHAAHPYTQALLNSVPRLDMDAGQKLYTIHGAPPELTGEMKGCAFADRCPYAMKVCRRLQPRMIPMGENDGEVHEAACFLNEPECIKARGDRMNRQEEM